MDIIIEDIPDQLGRESVNTRIRALVPFSARLPQDQAQLVDPPSFSDLDSNSAIGLRWAATSVVTRTTQGNFKLYLCSRKDLAMWVPISDWFYSNVASQAPQSIAEFARTTNSHLSMRTTRNHHRATPYDRPVSLI